MEPPVTCTLLTVGAPASFVGLGMPFCQEPLARICRNEPLSTSKSFEPLGTVTEDWRKVLAPICTVGSPLVALIVGVVVEGEIAPMRIAPITTPATPVKAGASQPGVPRFAWL